MSSLGGSKVHETHSNLRFGVDAPWNPESSTDRQLYVPNRDQTMQRRMLFKWVSNAYQMFIKRLCLPYRYMMGWVLNGTV